MYYGGFSKSSEFAGAGSDVEVGDDNFVTIILQLIPPFGPSIGLMLDRSLIAQRCGISARRKGASALRGARDVLRANYRAKLVVPISVVGDRVVVLL